MRWIRFIAILLSAAFTSGEITRSVVHQKRERQFGPGGGTQDIAMWGSFITLGCGVLAGVSWICVYAFGH